MNRRAPHASQVDLFPGLEVAAPISSVCVADPDLPVAAVATLPALSLRQPWLDAILTGGKRIENRVKWKFGSKFRGPLLLHAAKGMTKKEYAAVVAFCEERGIAWRPSPFADQQRGVLLARCVVTDVIMPGGFRHAGEGHRPSEASTIRHPLASDPYYMGFFAFVLDRIELLPTPIPYVGALTIFKVPISVLSPA